MFDIPWYVFALLGAFFVAIGSVVEKKVLFHDDPLHFSGGVAVVIGVLSIPFLFFIEWHHITPLVLLILYVISVLSMCAFYLTALSMRGLEAGELSVIMALTPAVTALLAFGFLGEGLTSKAILGLAIIIFGLFVLEFPSIRSGIQSLAFKKKAFYILIAFVSIFVYASSAILDRLTLSYYGVRPIDFLALVQVGTTMNFMLLSIIRGKHDQILSASLLREPVKVLSTSVLFFLSRIMYAQSVSMVFVALAAALKRTGALFTIVMARSYLKEQEIGHKLLAALIIILGVVAIIL